MPRRIPHWTAGPWMEAHHKFHGGKILKNLKSISNNKTTIIVSHRISSLKHADQIIVFENGKIVQQGKHIELMGVTGYYKELFEKQQADQAK